MDTKSYQINSKQVISETLDGETIIINLENGNYFSMNTSGTAIWDAIKDGKSISIDNKEISDFIAFLEKENLVTEDKNQVAQTKIDQTGFNNPKIEKYEDMQEMLLADPVHDVDTMGWPKLKEDK